MGERRARARGRRSRRCRRREVRSRPSTSISPLVVELDARGVEAERLDVRPAAGGDHEVVDLAPARRRSVNVTPSSPDCDVLHERRRVDLHPLLAERRGRRPWRCRRPRSAARGRAPRTAAPRCPAARRRTRSRRPTRPRRPRPASPAARSNAHASSVPITRPPNDVPGSGRGTEPVASTMHFDASSSRSPTVTVLPPASVPSPSTYSIWFFLKRPATPPVSVLMTFLPRAPRRARSRPSAPRRRCRTPPPRRPRTGCRRRAAPPSPGCTRTFRQRPPTVSFSTTAVFMPSCAARIAVT